MPWTTEHGMTSINQSQLAAADCLSRARGSMLGQLCGDALGSHVEFRSADYIKEQFPEGIRVLLGGGTHNTIAGQPTDDSEMALLLARSLAEHQCYDAERVREQYVYWMNSGPFDCGMTIAAALTGAANPESQANGALMRICPLGIFGSRHSLENVAEWARQDAAITHPHRVCQEANALFAMAIAHAVRNGPAPDLLYESILCWAHDMNVDPVLLESIMKVDKVPWIAKSSLKQGWVLVALQNALWQLVHAEDIEEGIVDTVSRGGDTDTNAAICGALLGAVHGIDGIPKNWTETVLNCCPKEGDAGVHQPRPEIFWPVDALELVDQLMGSRPQVD